jgi:hypothetical protein
MSPLFLAGMRGTGKTTTAMDLGDIAEVIDAEYLQYKAATAIEPTWSHSARYKWEFWTGERLRKLPTALNEAFLSKYGLHGPKRPYIVLVAAILVKDWYMSPMMAILNLHRSGICWSRALYLVLDFSPEEIHNRIQRRAELERLDERSITLEDVQRTAKGYRESHALKSMFPWQFATQPSELQEIVARLRREAAP